MQRACQNQRTSPPGTRPLHELGGNNKLFALWALVCALWTVCIPAAAAPDPSQTLLAGARQWVSEQRGVRPEAVTLGELDARIKVPVCKDAKGWQYDVPPGYQDSMRARCAQPSTQLYLRVSLPTPRSAAAPVVPQKETPSGQARAVVVLKQGLLRGARLTAEHLEVQQMPASQVPQQSIDNVDNAIDAELTRDLLAGKPIRSTDLRPAMLVKRGQTVTLTIRQEGGFAVVAQVEALQDGRKGESIRLKNRESGRILTGKVVGLLSVEGQ